MSLHANTGTFVPYNQIVANAQPDLIVNWSDLRNKKTSRINTYLVFSSPKNDPAPSAITTYSLFLLFLFMHLNSLCQEDLYHLSVIHMEKGILLFSVYPEDCTTQSVSKQWDQRIRSLVNGGALGFKRIQQRSGEPSLSLLGVQRLQDWSAEQ